MRGPTWQDELRHRPIRSSPEDKQLLDLLQHLHDGIQEIVITQPLDPFDYLAAYLQHTMALEVEPEDIALTKELHKIQISLGKIRRELHDLRSARLKALRRCLKCEDDLRVEETESIVTSADHDFLLPEPQRYQEDWCAPHTTPRDLTDGMDTSFPLHFGAISSGNKQSILEFILPECNDALKSKPTDPLYWLVRHFQSKSSQYQYRLNELKITLGRYRWYIDDLRSELPIAIENTKQATTHQHDLQAQLDERNRMIKHLSISHMVGRTETLMKGHEFSINREKKWIPLEYIEPIGKYTTLQLTALHRAEIYLMFADEVAYKAKLKFDREYAASTRIQAMYRCHVLYDKHKRAMETRHHAATVIQNKYERYLYAKAIRLPVWVVLGQQVIVAMTVARRAAITFQFYHGKDFTAGNFTTLPPPFELEVLKQKCRHDDKYAAFASDGSMKRFVPRQLSQLQVMKKEPLTPLDGIYIKKIPRDDSEVIVSAIITAIPPNKFGAIQVVFDGTGVVEEIPVQKLSLRWKHSYDFETDSWHYLDQLHKTKAPMAPAPYSDEKSRQREIEARKRSYALEQDEEYQQKKLQSAIILQCAYRNKKARKLFQFMLHLREKEKEHADKVDQVAQEVAKKKKKRRWWFR